MAEKFDKNYDEVVDEDGFMALLRKFQLDRVKQKEFYDLLSDAGTMDITLPILKNTLNELLYREKLPFYVTGINLGAHRLYYYYLLTRDTEAGDDFLTVREFKQEFMKNLPKLVHAKIDQIFIEVQQAMIDYDQDKISSDEINTISDKEARQIESILAKHGVQITIGYFDYEDDPRHEISVSVRQSKTSVFEGVAVFTFGRFQPPTLGHKLVIDEVVERSHDATHFIFPSPTQDHKKNPLVFEDKVRYLKEMFPNANIVEDRALINPFYAAKWLSENGYTDVTMVTGSDRVEQFQEGIGAYIGHPDLAKAIPLESWNVVSAGERVDEGDDVAGISGSKMRAFALDEDFESFAKYIPNQSLAEEIYTQVRKGMGHETRVDESMRRYIDLMEEDFDKDFAIQANRNYGAFLSQIVFDVIQLLANHGWSWNVEDSARKAGKEVWNDEKAGLDGAINAFAFIFDESNPRTHAYLKYQSDPYTGIKLFLKDFLRNWEDSKLPKYIRPSASRGEENLAHHIVDNPDLLGEIVTDLDEYLHIL